MHVCTVYSGARTPLWIGLTDLEVEGIFRWTSDGSVAVYTNWLPLEPTNDGGFGHCTMWVAPYESWNDVRCFLTKQFFCQYQI